MDNSPADASQRARRLNCTVSESSEDEEGMGTWAAQAPGTPTKDRHGGRFIDMTPRPSKFTRVDETPRVGRATVIPPEDDDHDGIRGYTLSHLRRVPELALLAKRVVEAESKRRAKDERKKRKEDEAKALSNVKAKATTKSYDRSSTSGIRGSGMSSTIQTTSALLGKGSEGEPVYAKMKRLFRYAIRQLYNEGSIVLWDGPNRPLPRPYVPIPQPCFLSSSDVKPPLIPSATNHLWKVSSTAGDSTVTTSASSVSQSSFDDDLGDLSDPSPEEEAYIPLTSAYLSKTVERAIIDIMSRPSVKSHGTKGRPRPGPSTDELVEHLHRRDERWARVGEWAVKEALECGREQGRLWCIGDGRWEVCG